MEKELRYYKKANGQEPLVEWLNKFKDHVVRSRIERRIERLEIGNYGDCEPVGEGVFEVKLHFGPGYRVYFAEVGKTIILLLCGGNKSTQVKDIETAKKYWRDLKGEE